METVDRGRDLGGDPKRDEGPPTQAWRPGDPSPRPAGSDRPGYRSPSYDRPSYDRPATSPRPSAERAPAREAERASAARAPRPDPAVTPATSPVQVRRLRRGRLAIRKISPWSTFKFSLVFFFCMLLIVLLGTAIIFAMLKAFGVIGGLERLLRSDLGFDVTISGGLIFRWTFLLGLVGTIVMSAIAMFMAFLYNLIADVVGGIELLVTERE